VQPDTGGETTSPDEVRWELEQIRKVAARFRGGDTEELEGELAAALIALKRRRPSGIRNWRAYLTKSLLNKASSLAAKWRARQGRETSADLYPDTLTPSSFHDADRALESKLEIERVRRILDAESLVLLETLAACRENQSRTAHLLGVHRNTIARRLAKVRAKLNCPIENVSERPDADIRASGPKLRVSDTDRSQLALMARASDSAGFRAGLVLALANGKSYAEIMATIRTTAPTIARWKRRFEEQGLAGLKSTYPGKQPRQDFQSRIGTWLRTHRRRERISHRAIARRLGLSKSTVHRILSKGRDHLIQYQDFD